VLTATDQKPQKSLKRLYYPPPHCMNVNVMLSNMTFLIFVIFNMAVAVILNIQKFEILTAFPL